MLVALAVIAPLLSAVLLAFVHGQRFAVVVNILCSAVGLALVLAVWSLGQVAPLAALFGVLSAFVGFTMALAMGKEAFGASESWSGWRFGSHHALFQAVLGNSMLGLYADNTALLWLSLALWVVITALWLASSGTQAGLKAAWLCLLAGGAGVGLGLLGTLLVYLTALPVTGAGLAALRFASLSAHAPQMAGAGLSLGFIFIIFGYGSLLVLLPLLGLRVVNHTSASRGLLGIMQLLPANVVLLAILRFEHLAQINTHSLPSGLVLLIFAVLFLLFVLFFMLHQRQTRRFFGLSVIQQAVIPVFAFGVGGPVAIFGGLLHMILHTLLHSGGVLALWRARAGRYVGWMSVLLVVALSGLPPSGLFVSEFMIIQQAILRVPLVCLPFCIGLGVYGLLILRRAGVMMVAVKNAAQTPCTGWGTYLALLHLLLVFGLAFLMPESLVRMLALAAKALQ